VLITIITVVLFPNLILVFCHIFFYDFPKIRNHPKIFLKSFENVASNLHIISSWLHIGRGRKTDPGGMLRRVGTQQPWVRLTLWSQVQPHTEDTGQSYKTISFLILDMALSQRVLRQTARAPLKCIISWVSDLSGKFRHATFEWTHLDLRVSFVFLQHNRMLYILSS